MAKSPAAKKAPSKSEVFKGIAEKTGVSRKDVKAVFEELSAQIGRALKKGPGLFTIPGLAKIIVKRVAAKPARMGINPFTKQEVMFKAKPARNVIKVRPLKALKDLV
jgi:nucleoid DNA-binding protein